MESKSNWQTQKNSNSETTLGDLKNKNETSLINRFNYINKAKHLLLVALMSITLSSNKSNDFVDLSSEKKFSDAFAKAKNEGVREFKWKDKKYITVIKNIEDTPIQQRDDFIGNGMSEFGLAWAELEANMSLDDDLNQAEHPYDKLFDLYRYYFGQPLEHNILSVSSVGPENAKDKKARYISINDEDFIRDVLKEYNELKKPLKIGESARVSGYRKFMIPKNNTTSAIGNFTIGRGIDEKGEYVSYYDIFDRNEGEAEQVFGAKGYEIYGRIYLRVGI